MTDKEKANRHIKNNYVIFEDIMQVEYQLDSLREKDYLAGLAEGRKDLEKENAELKAQIELYSEKVSYWEEQSKLKDSQLEEQDRQAFFTVAKFDELKAQNKGLIHLLESIQSAISGIKKNKDKEIVLYWIEENAIRVFKEEKQKGFSFDWLK